MYIHLLVHSTALVPSLDNGIRPLSKIPSKIVNVCTQIAMEAMVPVIKREVEKCLQHQRDESLDMGDNERANIENEFLLQVEATSRPGTRAPSRMSGADTPLAHPPSVSQASVV